MSLNEQARRAEHASIEARQLALENARRQAKGEQPLTALQEEPEDGLDSEEAHEPAGKDDAFLAETGRILLDYLSLGTRLAKH